MTANYSVLFIPLFRISYRSKKSVLYSLFCVFDQPDRFGEDGEQQEEEPEEVPETRIDIEIPRIKTDLGNAQHFVKLPNFLSMETR